MAVAVAGGTGLVLILALLSAPSRTANSPRSPLYAELLEIIGEQDRQLEEQRRYTDEVVSKLEDRLSARLKEEVDLLVQRVSNLQAQLGEQNRPGGQERLAIEPARPGPEPYAFWHPEETDQILGLIPRLRGAHPLQISLFEPPKVSNPGWGLLEQHFSSPLQGTDRTEINRVRYWLALHDAALYLRKAGHLKENEGEEEFERLIRLLEQPNR
jgi:hypothetical protein